MAGEDLLDVFDRLAGEVRHPTLTLDVFTTAPMNGSDDALDEEPDDVAIAQRLDLVELQKARRRRGALMFAANLMFDRILDDLVVPEDKREALGLQQFADEHLPPRFRHRYDPQFLRQMLATAAKVAQDLATDDYCYPSCTAEELVLWAVLHEWQALLDMTELGQGWTDLSEYLFEDLDFEYLFDQELDGVEDDPLARKTSGMEVSPFTDWFVPFNIDSRVHPYAVDLREREQDLFDLTQIDADDQHIVTDVIALQEMPTTVTGLDPISDLVAAARRDSRTRQAPDEWIPDESKPVASFAELARRAVVSGILTQQTGLDGQITEVPVLSFIPQPTHPATGTAWAEVMYFSGRTELPLAAVVSFRPDPAVRERWLAAFPSRQRES